MSARAETFFVPGPLPGVNEMIRAAKSGRGKANAYARMKAQWTNVVHVHARAARVPAFDGPVTVTLTWYEPDRRRDIDNVAAGVKFVLDGLVAAKVIGGDGWRHVQAISHGFEVSTKLPGVLVMLTEGVPF